MVIETYVVILPFGVVLAYATIPKSFLPMSNGPIKGKVVMINLNA